MDSFLKIGHLQDVDFDETGAIKMNLLPGAGVKPVMIFIYGSYCGHCHKAKPHYAKVFSQQKQSKVFMTALQTDDNDPSVQALMKRFPGILKANGISFNGVPTYIMYNPATKKYTEYKGGRDEESLLLFINSF